MALPVFFYSEKCFLKTAAAELTARPLTKKHRPIPWFLSSPALLFAGLYSSPGAENRSQNGSALEQNVLMRCTECNSTTFRLSRFRTSDLLWFLILHYPVRCRKCNERHFANFFSALRVRKQQKARRIERNRKRQAEALERQSNFQA